MAAPYGGGQQASKQLRASGFLACGIGLPVDPVEKDMNGLRIGTPELVRWGMSKDDAPRLASLIARALNNENVAQEVFGWRGGFDRIHFVHST